jgi:hypothetical protein
MPCSFSYRPNPTSLPFELLECSRHYTIAWGQELVERWLGVRETVAYLGRYCKEHETPQGVTAESLRPFTHVASY